MKIAPFALLISGIGALAAGGACHRLAGVRPPGPDAGVMGDSGSDAWSPPDLGGSGGASGDGGGGAGGGEICDNALDDNGNGLVDETCACQPGAKQQCFPAAVRLAGIGVCKYGVQTCGGSEFGGWGACQGAQVPGPELCDGLDNDCNGRVDDGCTCTPGTKRACYDGPASTRQIGACADGTQICLAGPGGVGSSWGPCTGQAGPAAERCDGADNDCNGTVDDGCACTLGDTRSCYGGPSGTAGVGPCRAGTQTCVMVGDSVGWGPCAGQTLPAAEICDHADNDCDGVADDGCACEAGATRACYDGPGATRGVGLCADGMQVCVAGPGGVGSSWGACTGQRLPAPEICDDLDQNCDGVIDDGCACRRNDARSCYDGVPGTVNVGPCHAGTQGCIVENGSARWGACTGEVTPGFETCNGVDDDCDGSTDENLTLPCGMMVGACRPGTQACVNGKYGACTGAVGPTMETCNDVDDDCDGVVDNGCVCRRGDTRGCYTGPAGSAGVGVCRAGTQSCVISNGVASWGTCTGQTLPGAETCNNADDDCNGRVDDALTRPCGSSVGDCRPGTETCAAGAWGACLGGVGPMPEDCNGGDENCNGVVDEGCSCLDGTQISCGTDTGACVAGKQTCVNGQYGPCTGSVGPVTETCNDADDDCDGVVDNGCVCRRGDTQSCYAGPAGTAGVGACKAGTQSCQITNGVASWGPCTGQVLPVTETCNHADDDCDGTVDDGFSALDQVLSTPPPNRDVDIVFMIDNSLSMDPNQASLIANFPVLMQTLRGFQGGLPNLHLGVVTSNLGAGPVGDVIQCPVGGDGGNFHAPVAGCNGPTGTNYIVALNGETTKNYPGTIDDAFACIANVGTQGCGFEHQLASAAVALGFNGAIPAANVGFLRPSALLAVVFITNEDDCSAPPDAAIFSTVSQRLADPLGPLASFRCNEFGHLCGGVAPPRLGTTPVTLSDCHSAEDGVLIRVSELASFFQSLKPDPSMLFISSIAALPTPYTVTYQPDALGEVAPFMAHSCTRADGANGDPAVRMAEFTGKFGANGTFSSICDDSYAPALSQLGATIGRALGPLCLAAAVADTDPAKAGIQASCQVVERAPGAADRTLPACDMASPQGGPVPCWYIAPSATGACPSGVQLQVNRATPPATGTTLGVRCTAC